jgi:hypothetical protein
VQGDAPRRSYRTCVLRGKRLKPVARCPSEGVFKLRASQRTLLGLEDDLLCNAGTWSRCDHPTITGLHSTSISRTSAPHGFRHVEPHVHIIDWASVRLLAYTRPHCGRRINACSNSSTALRTRSSRWL